VAGVAAGLPQGKEIESIALRRLKQWASFLDPEFNIPSMYPAWRCNSYDALPKPARSPGSRSKMPCILQVAALLHVSGTQPKKRSRRSNFACPEA